MMNWRIPSLHTLWEIFMYTITGKALKTITWFEWDVVQFQQQMWQAHQKLWFRNFAKMYIQFLFSSQSLTYNFTVLWMQ